MMFLRSYSNQIHWEEGAGVGGGGGADEIPARKHTRRVAGVGGGEQARRGSVE